MPKNENPKEVTQLAPPHHFQISHNGKDEMNLAEFPIARLGRSDNRLTIEYQGQTIDKTGAVLEQKWIVSGSAQFGLPTEFAERVLVGLMTLTAREKFESRKVPFTIYKVLKLLGLTHNQRNYSAVEKALQQLVGVTIFSEGAFFDKKQNKRVTTKKGFHLVEEFWLRSFEADDEAKKEHDVNGYIIWSDRLWESFKAGYIKNLDIDFYYSLESTITRRLFRFLDKRMRYQDDYQIDIFDLAGRLGMKKYNYPSQVARKMKPAFDELQQQGYLESVDVIKVGKYTRVQFFKEESYRNHQAPLFDSYDEVCDGETPATASQRDHENLDPLEAIYQSHGTSQELKELWRQVLPVLQTQMAPGLYQKVKATALLNIDQGEATVGMASNKIASRSKAGAERQVITALNMFSSETVNTVAFVDA